MSAQERGMEMMGDAQLRAVPSRPSGPFFAAIDLGTNNCRLMIAARTSSGFRVVDSFNRCVGLGEGLKVSGRLADDAMNRTIEALRICAERLHQWPLTEIRAVATEACRRAGNGKDFLSRVFRETGLKIDIISPREEAELAVESCSGLFNHCPAAQEAERGVLFDIGGGSTEIAWVRLDQKRSEHTLIGTTSIPIGVISLEETFGRGHGSSYDEMVSHVCEQLAPFESVHCIYREVMQGRTRLIGTSGTVTTLAGVALALPRYNRAMIDGATLPGSTMCEAIQVLRELGPQGLAAHPCVGPDRSRYVLPGCAIFEAIHQMWPIEQVTIADRGLRDGMLARMARDHALHSASVRRRMGVSRFAKPYSATKAAGFLNNYVTL
ncbi:Ppx/GppA family phosphatase [Neokomagataea tanensis]|uniref:Ppx/GppA family phosphatase n=1 Tax=Neokomagataea tanensis TaxID=661191 RepID=A0A4Y6VAP6_9PROT|nr:MULTISPECIES: Ppx/GppA phosphatase family protein [Neokomagataea]QDH25596.1 Ppx/GppA family phosphatase [Neokomagataea tanensis]